jgi:hypothetical protein
VLKTKQFDALGKGDPCSRPQKIKCRILMANVSHSGNNHKRACSSRRPYISCNVSSVNEYDKAADLNDQSKLFLSCSSSICSNLADDGKIGYGFTLADVIPRSEKEGTKPAYVCPGCSNHTHGNNMINRCNVVNKRVIFLT